MNTQSLFTFLRTIIICLALSPGLLRAFEIQLGTDRLRTLPGVTHETVSLSVTEVDVTDLTFSSDQGWISVEREGNKAVVVIDATTLTQGEYSGTITATDGSDSRTTNIAVEVVRIGLQRVIADIDSPWVYLLTRRIGIEEGQDIVLVGRVNTESLNLIDTVVVYGRYDELMLHPRDGTLWLSGREDATVTGLDKETLEITQVVNFENQGFFGNSGLPGPNGLQAGMSGQMIALSLRPDGLIPLFNTQTGEILDTVSQPGGIGVTSVSGEVIRFSASDFSQEVIRTFDLLNGRFEKVKEEVFPTGGATQGERIVSSEDGSVHYTRAGRYDENLRRQGLGYQTVDLSWTGRRMLLGGGVYEGEELELVMEILGGAQNSVFSPDQTKVIQIDSNTKVVTASEIPDPDSKASKPLFPLSLLRPADLPVLRWTGHPLATDYQVYLSTDQGAVARRDALVLLNSVTRTQVDLPENLVGGATYYWTIDRKIGEEIEPGDIFEFRNESAGVNPPEVLVESLLDLAETSFTLATINKLGGSWSVSSEDELLEFEKASGEVGEEIRVTIDLTQFVVDDPRFGKLYETSIQVEFGDEIVDVPVELNLFHSRPFQLLQASPNDDTFIYLTQGSISSFTSRLFIVEADLTSGKILRTAQAPLDGKFYQDFEGNHLYQVGSDRVRTYDLRTMTLISEVFLEFEVTPIGIADGFILAFRQASRPSKSQYVTLDLASGEFIAVLEESVDLPFFLRATLCRYQGDEQLLVYRSVDDGQGGTIGRLEQVGRNSFIELHSATGVPNPRLDYQSTTPLISRDGERIFIQNYMLSRDLSEITEFEGGQFLAIDKTGDRATNGEFFYTDPPSKFLEFTGGRPRNEVIFTENNNYLVYFYGLDDGIGTDIVITDLRTAAPFPIPTPIPGAEFDENPTSFSIGEIPGATSYVLTVTKELNGEEVARVEGGSELSLTRQLPPGFRYLWRIDAITEDGVVEGVGIGFKIGLKPSGKTTVFSPYTISAQPTRFAMIQNTGAGIAATPANESPGVALDQVSMLKLDPFSGSDGFPGLNAKLELAGNYMLLSDPDGVRVYEEDVTGCFEFQRTLTSSLGHSGRFYGSEMASNDSEFFIASSNTAEGPVSIEIYQAVPELKRVQILTLPDLIEGEDSNLSFTRMAAGGDVLAISSGDRARSQNGPLPRANLLIYVRDEQSGQWVLQQTLEGNPRFGALTTVSTDGKTIAWSGNFASPGSEDVRMFRRNESRVWEPDGSVTGDRNADGFGLSVLVQGDTLIVRSFGPNQSGDDQNEQIIIYRRNQNVWQLQTVHIPDGDEKFGNSFGTRDLRYLFARVGTTLFMNALPGVLAFDRVFSESDTPGFLSKEPYQFVAGQPFEGLIELSDSGQIATLEEGPGWISLTSIAPGVYRLEGEAPASGGSGVVRIKASTEKGVAAYQIFDLKPLPANGAPQVAVFAEEESLFSGDSVVLRSVATGAAPRSYEWFYNGEKIEGANRSTLPLLDLRVSHSGSYSVLVENAAGKMMSEPVEVTVSRATNFGGSWRMARGDARHRLFVPANLGQFEVEKVWSLQGRSYWNLATQNGRVFLSSRSRDDGRITALNIEDGSTRWEYQDQGLWRYMSPAVDEEGLYMTGYLDERGRSDSKIFSLDQADGSIQWTRNLQSSDRPKGLLITDPVIGETKYWMPTVNSGGLQAWNLQNGARVSGPQLRQLGDIITPSLAGDFGYLLEKNEVVKIDLNGVAVSQNLPLSINETSGWIDQILPIQGNTTFVRRFGEIYAYDLESKVLKWTATLTPEELAVGTRMGTTLAVSSTRVSSFVGNQIRSYDIITGAELPAIDLPAEPIEDSYPLLLNDVVIATTSEGTHIISLATGMTLKTLPEIGNPIYAEGYLFILDQAVRGIPEGITAYRVDSTGRLDVLTETIPDATEDQVYETMLEVDGSEPRENIDFELIEGPTWISLGSNGILSGTPLHQQGGKFDIVFRVTDGVNMPVEATLPITVFEVNDAPIITPLTIEMDEDSPGFEQFLTTFVSDEETDTDDLTVQAVLSEGELDLVMIVIEDQTFKILPRPDLFGETNVVVRVMDPDGQVSESEIPITIAPVNDQPRLAKEIPDIQSTQAGSEIVLNLEEYFFEVDPDDVLTFEISSNSNAVIFSEVSIFDQSKLRFQFAPAYWGSSTIKISATDPDGLTLTDEFEVTLPEPPSPQAMQIDVVTLNRRTGLYQQKISVKNSAERTVGGFELKVSGLTAGYQLHGFDGDKFLYLNSIEAGEEVILILEYHSETSRSLPTPAIDVQLIFPLEAPLEEPGELSADRIIRLPDDSMIVEFRTTPGRRYQIQYSTDMATWTTSQSIIKTDAIRVQWLDQGPPKTDCHPRDCRMRFYRVIPLPVSEND